MTILYKWKQQTNVAMERCLLVPKQSRHSKKELRWLQVQKECDSVQLLMLKELCNLCDRRRGDRGSCTVFTNLNLVESIYIKIDSDYTDDKQRKKAELADYYYPTCPIKLGLHWQTIGHGHVLQPINIRLSVESPQKGRFRLTVDTCLSMVDSALSDTSSLVIQHACPPIEKYRFTVSNDT